MAVAVTCTKDFTIPEAETGIDWSTINWTTVNFFEAPPLSHSAGSAVGDTVICACDGTPAASSGGLTLIGDLVYTGPLVNAKVTITGGPFSTVELMAWDFHITHSTAGLLLDITNADITTSPQEFNFVVPVSVADTITLEGDQGGGLFCYTQNAPGVISFTMVFDNQ